MIKSIVLVSASIGLLSTSALAAPKPEFGTFGFDTTGMDKTVKPGDSFYDYASGAWAKNTPIPSDKPAYGMFNHLADLSEARTREIIEAASKAKAANGTEAQKVGDYYASFMDEAAIEAKGLKPLQGEMESIAAIRNRTDLMREFALMNMHSASVPFSVSINQDDKQPDRYIVNLGQGGLGLPDRDMYDLGNKQFDKLRQSYKTLLIKFFTLAKLPNAETRAAAVYALEEKIAAAHWTQIEQRDPVKMYNKMSPADIAKLAPGINWSAYLTSAGLAKETEINVNQTSAIAKLAPLVEKEPLAVWRDYLMASSLNDAGALLPKAFVDARFDVYGKALAGTPQIRVRWKRGVASTEGALGEAVGKLYVEKYFTPATKARADALVKNLLVSMGNRLDGLTWMSPETKTKAKIKLATYMPKIGYPSQWRDYGNLHIKAGDALGNSVRAAVFEYNRNLAKLGKPVDRTEWGMTPQTVNAYYNPLMNEIVFPAAILQAPFFDPNADDAINYGGIGVVIGHEISHGFDDQGSQYDSTGALKNWWTEADAKKFKEATNKLVAQYDAYCPFEGPTPPKQCVKGELTLGENIADLAGLTIAHEAYKLSLGSKNPKTLGGLTGDQRFFLGFAQVWRQNMRPEFRQSLLVSDPHSPPLYRTSEVRNIDAWYDAFGAKPGEKLYLDPDTRIRIW